MKSNLKFLAVKCNNIHRMFFGLNLLFIVPIKLLRSATKFYPLIMILSKSKP